MKIIASAFALSTALITAPAHAQSDPVVDAAEAAAEAVAEAAGDAVEGERMVEPSPPAVEIAAPPRSKLDRSPRLKRYRFIIPVDYPIASWNEDEEGTVEYSVDVNEDGSPERCSVTETSGFARLDSATCALVMERAEFRPALNEDREPIAGTYEGRERWRKREPEMPQMSLIFQYTHDETGMSSDCKFLKMENLPEKMLKDIERDKERGRLCRGFGAGGGVPYRDANGVPIAKRVTVSMDVVLEEPAEIPSE